MRSRCVSRSLSLPLCQMVRTDSGESENRIPSSLKSCQATKSCDTATRGAAESHFCVSVISMGQHEIAPFGPGLLLLAGAGDLRFEWRHSGMSAVSPSPLLRAASLLLETAAMLVCEPAIAGSAHPITHASTAIHREIATVIPALTMCQVEFIFSGLYTFRSLAAGSSSHPLPVGGLVSNSEAQDKKGADLSLLPFGPAFGPVCD